jgi:hypothetical protein
MTDTDTILRTARSVLVVDWPTKDLPETLFWAGFAVFVKSGPGPDDFVVYEPADDGSIRRDRIGRPEHVDLIHVYQPVNELPAFVELAVALGGTTVWILSGLGDDGARDPQGCWLPPERSAEARRIVEAAGLDYIERPSILEAIRAAGIEGSRR